MRLESLLNIEVDDLGVDFSTRNADAGHCHGQLEASRTSAAWVDVQNAFAGLDGRLVRVTAAKPAAGSRSSCDISCNTRKRQLADLDGLGHREFRRPSQDIDIAAHSNGGGDCAQLSITSSFPISPA